MWWTAPVWPAKPHAHLGNSMDSEMSTLRNRRQSYDYIVVGGGTAGCIVAKRLAERRNVRVLVLEQGPKNTSWTVRIPGGLRENFKPGRRYMKWYPTVPQLQLANRVINHPRGVGLGGSSLVNGMVFLRGHREDYDRWAREGASGWSYSDVLPFFRKLETFFQGANEYRGGDGPVGVRRQEKLHPLNETFLEAGREAGYPFTDDVNGREQEGFCRFDMNVEDGYRASASFAYLEKLGGEYDVDLVTESLVCRILFDRLRAIGVEYIANGQLRTVYGEREIIVCAGAIGSPQLLLLSGIGPADELRSCGIDPIVNLAGVGRNLQDHLELDLQWECREAITINGLLRADKLAWIGLQWLLFRSGMAATNQCHVGAFIRSRMEASHPNIQLHFFPVCFDGWVPRRDTHGFRIAAGPMRPTSRGELRLRSSDPREPPTIDPRYLSTMHDQLELRESYAVLQNLVSQKAFSRFRGPPLEPKSMPSGEAEVDRMIADFSTSGFHLCGSCKMGDERDPSAVVDPMTRVRGIDALRVVDASIMPSIVSSNINAPVMMIAERASDLIRGTQWMRPQNVLIGRQD